MKIINKIHVVVSALGLVLATHANADAADPKTAPDDTWISVSGTVVKAEPDSFQLDYGEGVITVEMDDFDFYAEGKHLLVNDQVVVYGKIDDDLFEKRTIEASSVYVENLMTHFYASAADEEDFGVWTVITPIRVGQTEISGKVTSIDGRVFTVDTGKREVRVDTASLAFNPLDDTGFLKIEVGDRVKVSGKIRDPLFEKRQLKADWIIELGRRGKTDDGQAS